AARAPHANRRSRAGEAALPPGKPVAARLRGWALRPAAEDLFMKWRQSTLAGLCLLAALPAAACRGRGRTDGTAVRAEPVAEPAPVVAPPAPVSTGKTAEPAAPPSPGESVEAPRAPAGTGRLTLTALD